MSPKRAIPKPDKGPFPTYDPLPSLCMLPMHLPRLHEASQVCTCLGQNLTNLATVYFPSSTKSSLDCMAYFCNKLAHRSPGQLTSFSMSPLAGCQLSTSLSCTSLHQRLHKCQNALLWLLASPHAQHVLSQPNCTPTSCPLACPSSNSHSPLATICTNSHAAKSHHRSCSLSPLHTEKTIILSPIVVAHS